MPHRTRITLAVAVLAALLVVPSAFARGGSGGGGGGGGGGTTTSYAAISRVSGGALCSAGTTISVVLDKGANKQIEGTISMIGGTNADGTSTLFGGWTVMLSNDTTGASLGGFGTSFGETVPSVLITNLFGGVTAGSYDLTLSFTKRPFGELLGSTAPILESCAVHFAVIAR